MRTPVQASSLKSPRPGGISGTRPMEMARRTVTAMMNRIATKEIGGRSRRPSLIASHVELQIRQSATNAATAANFARFSGIVLIPRQRLDRVGQSLKSHQADIGTVMEWRQNIQSNVAMRIGHYSNNCTHAFRRE